MVLVTSCIFHNFNNVVRAGVNATMAFQKSVIKDSKGHSIHCVNPKAIMVDRCSIQSPKKSGIIIEWLKFSDKLDQARNIFISGNEIKSTGKDGIVIQSYL